MREGGQFQSGTIETLNHSENGNEIAECYLEGLPEWQVITACFPPLIEHAQRILTNQCCKVVEAVTQEFEFDNSLCGIPKFFQCSKFQIPLCPAWLHFRF